MSNSNSLAMPKDFNERVTNKVRDVFMDLIPNEQLDSLVQKEIKAFFEESNQQYTIVESSSYSSTKKIDSSVTPFRMLVWTEVGRLVGPKLQEIFGSDQWKTEVIHTDTGQDVALSELLDKKLDDMVTRMAKTMFTNMFEQAVGAAKYELTQDIKNSLNQSGIPNYL